MTAAPLPTSSSVEQPVAWLDLLEPRLVDKTAIPFVNYPELFSMKEMASRLGSLFHLSGGQLTLGDPQKMEEASSLSDPSAISHGYRMGVIPDPLYWIMNRDEAERLITLLLKGKQDFVPELDPDLVDAFMRYLSLEALLHLRALGFNDRLLVECMGPGLPKETGAFLRLPLSWTIQDALFTSSLVIPETFIDHWNRYFQQEHERKPLSDSLAKQVSIVIHLDIGMVTLPQKEWAEVQVGDFILLDQCTLVPGKDKGRVRLTASNIPLFRAMVKEETIKLLEHSVYQEMEAPMSQKLPDSKPQPTPPKQPSAAEEENELSEEESEGEFEESGDWEESDWEESEEETEEETEEEESGEYLAANPPPSKSEEKPVSPATQAKPTQPPQAASTQAKPEKSKDSQEEGPLTPVEQIPFTINIEVGRIKMSLAELRRLAPGQVLDLTIHPEKGVQLVIEGRTIGRGELLRLGESVGVRVTEVG